MRNIWSETHTVTTQDADFQQKWAPASFFRVMVEAGSSHATRLGYDYQEMLASDMAWVLARSRVQFLRFPLIGDLVTIQTWPKGIYNKIFFMRDFFFLDKNGSKLAAASSAFLLINTQTRRILPPHKLIGELPDNDGLSALNELLDKFILPETMTEHHTVQPGYSSIDLLGHVNNVRYIEWVSDCFTLEQYQSKQLDWMQINFINEVKSGDSISIAKGQSATDSALWFIQGINQSIKKTAFEATLRWVN